MTSADLHSGLKQRRAQAAARSGQLRHSFGTLLKANGEDVKVVQELMRHANVSVTMDRYVQAMTAAKRQAQSLAYWSQWSQIRSYNVCK